MPSGRSNLENLARAKQLNAEPPDEREIGKLLRSARTYLRDARRADISVETRFTIAYSAAHALALAALRSAGFRPSSSGHRRILFQTLAFAAGASKQLSLALAQHHDRRNKFEYEASQPSELEAEDLIKLVSQLEELVAERVKRP